MDYSVLLSLNKRSIINRVMSARNRARRNSPLYLPSAFELWRPSKELVKKNIWVFGPLYAVPMLFLINSWITNTTGMHGRHLWDWMMQNRSAGWSGDMPFIPSYSWGIFLGFIGFWVLVWLAISIIVHIMTQKAQLDAAQGHSLHFQRLWGTVKELGWRLLGLYIVAGLIILVGFAIFIVPGLFMLRRYLMAPYVMLDKKCSISEAMEKSAKLSLKNTGAVWGIIGVLFLVALVNVIPFIGGLAAFLLGMFYSVAPALRYEQLKSLG